MSGGEEPSCAERLTCELAVLLVLGQDLLAPLATLLNQALVLVFGPLQRSLHLRSQFSFLPRLLLLQA